MIAIATGSELLLPLVFGVACFIGATFGLFYIWRADRPRRQAERRRKVRAARAARLR